MIFLLWGIGNLLPWNVVLCTFDFFRSQMTGYRPTFIFPFAANGLLLIIQVLLLIYGAKLPEKIKLQYGFYAISVLILSLPFIAYF